MLEKYKAKTWAAGGAKNQKGRGRGKDGKGGGRGGQWNKNGKGDSGGRKGQEQDPSWERGSDMKHFLKLTLAQR